MKQLNRKLLRDLWHLKGQMLAVTAVVLCGIAVFVSMTNVKYSLEVSRSDYYSRYRFADLFMQCKRAPEFLLGKVSRIPGVATVSTRIVTDVTVDVPGLDEPATAHLVSLPGRGDPALNGVFIAEGRMPDPSRPEEVVVSKPFMKANRLQPGDQIGVVINGRWKRLQIVGVGLSPEYIYEVQPGAFFPDNRRFGVFWMSREALESALDMSGAFNDMALTLAHGASEKEVIRQLDRVFARYGSLGAYGRDQQLSDRFIADEIRILGIQITILPTIFLAVAVFLLNIVLRRLVSTQREQIAVLKAMGYSNEDIGLHVLGFALVPTVAGVIVGTAAGAWLGTLFLQLYRDVYNFPALLYVFRIENALAAVLLSFGAAIAGALEAARQAVALPPAEAMRPESPPIYKPGILDNPQIARRFSTPLRIIVRNIERHPFKAALSVTMIALSMAILVVTRYAYDAVERMSEVEFGSRHREDVTVIFNDAMPPSTTFSFAAMPGVLDAEYYREEPVRLQFGHHSRRQTLKGLQRTDGLQRLADSEDRLQALPERGLLLTTTLADLLGVGPGDVVQVEFLQGARRSVSVPVAGTIDELLGLSAYLRIEELNRLAGDGGALSAAVLKIDGARRAAMYERFKQTPGVAGTMMLSAMKKSFDEMIAKSMNTSTFILTSFACVLAFAMMYNGARITLSERVRELSSLRVLGMTKKEIAVILLGEQAIFCIAAIPVGFLIGIGLSVLLAGALSSELYRMPLIFTPVNFLFAFAVMVTVAIVTGLIVGRRLHTLDLIAVLKTRE
ncbi:MAG: ABC transporter permease [Chlorobiaceae bacterium]|nr:ABC transporter permease [Chlorobiaceae bacterium]